ncbi:MAG: PVC-type heme-binding CxxCH protein, partial [Verrucomicrobiota bacterium]
GDDQPDGPAQVLLDGWDMNSKHNAFNGLTWGPDGWLYGCNGILGNGKIGQPGTPDEQRVPFNCGVWRFHPLKKKFEVVATGTTNPWGIAFDQYGQMFVANCVIKHLFHVIPGAHYSRMFGQDFSPFYFDLIPSIADHIHWIGGAWNVQGSYNPQNDVTGGGHAHCGAFIYQGEDWPEKYRNSFFTINIHGHRVNNDLLVRQGSGYIGKHGADFLRVNDTWFRGVALAPSADGGLYVTDWSDAGECHDYDDIHRENGRIYKVVFGSKPPRNRDLSKTTNEQLVSNLRSKDEWLASHSRLLLQERAAKSNVNESLDAALQKMISEPDLATHQKLNALWTLHALGALKKADGKIAANLLGNHDQYIRAWTIQLLLEEGNPSDALVDRLSELAGKDSSPVVRLYLASALQKIGSEARVKVATGLVQHSEDASDHNVPLMIWYGIEPVVGNDEQAALKLLAKAEIPLIREYIAQRLALRGALNGLTEAVRNGKDAFQADVVRGMFAALNGQNNLPPPANWERARKELQEHSSPQIREKALRLALIFGDRDAAGILKGIASNTKLGGEERSRAIAALAQKRVPGLAGDFQNLLGDKAVRLAALEALASYDDPATPAAVIQHYAQLNTREKSVAVNTLASRSTSAIALLEAVQAGKIPAGDISPFATRQMEAYKDARINSLLAKLATVRPVASDKKAAIAKFKSLFTPAALRNADASQGRVLFERTCAACHTLFGEGGKLAPELTGAQRSNLDYLLDNIVDPNAVVWDQYKATYFETKDDRLISGVIQGENESTVTVQTPTGLVQLPVNEIATRRKSELSLMPEGLLESLKDDEIVNLISYLQSPQQVPLPS